MVAKSKCAIMLIVKQVRFAQRGRYSFAIFSGPKYALYEACQKCKKDCSLHCVLARTTSTI